MSNRVSTAIQLKAKTRYDLLHSGQTKIVCRSIWLLITRKCPHECRHCYFCGSPHGESMSIEQARQTIAHLPANVETIGISGGEPFTEPKLLRKTLEFIQQRQFRNLTQVNIQTTGFWANNRAQVVRTVRELIALGTNSFYVYGDDPWHHETGLKPEQPALLIDVLQHEFGAQEMKKGFESLYSLFDRNSLTYSKRETVNILPIGRAAWATTPEEWQTARSVDHCKCRDFLTPNPNGYLYTINFNGEMHFCIFQTTPPLGNIFEQPLLKILRQAQRSEMFRVLDRGDILEFAEKIAGETVDEAEAGIQRHGCCVYCTQLNRELYEGKPEEPVLFSVYRNEKNQKGIV